MVKMALLSKLELSSMSQDRKMICSDVVLFPESVGSTRGPDSRIVCKAVVDAPIPAPEVRGETGTVIEVEPLDHDNASWSSDPVGIVLVGEIVSAPTALTASRRKSERKNIMFASGHGMEGVQ